VRTHSKLATIVALLAITFLALARPRAQEPKGATIEGLVLSRQHAIFIKFRVEIVKGKWRRAGVSDSDGHFEFDGLEPGIYILQPEKTKPECLVPLRRVRITVVKDEKVHADLMLRPADDYEEKCVVDQSHP